MTQQQLDAAVQLSNRISEIRQRLLNFDKAFTLDETGKIQLYAGGTLLAAFNFDSGMPAFAEDFLAAYRRHLAAQLKAAEMEFENI